MRNYTNDIEMVSQVRYRGADAALLRAASGNKTYLVLKRLMDIVGASVGLLLFSPLFAVVALLIKLTDPKGPVFFKQVRVGLEGRQFYMYKFRSMVSNAEELLADLLEKNEIEGAMFKMKDDPRITKVGRFIRKTSIDELPQLWNVLKGDMSLVGPRPPLPRELAQYTSQDKLRLLVVPGCTGYWQVSGRNGLTFKQMVDMDLYYIEHRGLWMDIKLILKTFVVMLLAKDAY